MLCVLNVMVKYKGKKKKNLFFYIFLVNINMQNLSGQCSLIMHQSLERCVCRYLENLKAKLMCDFFFFFFLVGYGYVVCGDEQGSLWMYHITDTMMENFKSGKTISATEVS